MWFCKTFYPLMDTKLSIFSLRNVYKLRHAISVYDISWHFPLQRTLTYLPDATLPKEKLTAIQPHTIPK